MGIPMAAFLFVSLVLASYGRRVHAVGGVEIADHSESESKAAPNLVSGRRNQRAGKLRAPTQLQQLARVLLASNPAGNGVGFDSNVLQQVHNIGSTGGFRALMPLRGGSAMPMATGSLPRGPSQRSFDPSIQDLEESVTSAWYTLSGLAQRLCGLVRSHRRTGAFIGGALGLCFGGSTAFTILFFKNFGSTGWPIMKKALLKGKAAYDEAKANAAKVTGKETADAELLSNQLKDLATQLASLRNDGASKEKQQAVIQQMQEIRSKLDAAGPSTRRAIPVLLAAFEPEVVRDVVLGLWSGVTASLAATCSSAVRTFGVGVSLGEVVYKSIQWTLEKLKLLFHQMRTSLPSEAVMLLYAGPSLVGTATLKLIGRSIGCWIAFRAQELASVLTVSLLSARLFLQAMDPYLATEEAHNTTIVAGEGQGHRWWRLEGSEELAWMMAVGSLLQQRKRDFKLPLFMKVPLLPLLGVEALLEKLADNVLKKEMI